MQWPWSNFTAEVFDKSGELVPGSKRIGHNIFTFEGKEWLRQLLVSSTRATDLRGGALANVVPGAPAGQKKVTGISGMSTVDVGRLLQLRDSGDNDGAFIIQSVLASDEVNVVDAAPGTIPDANNGAINWSMFSGADESEERRLRYAGVGSGAQLEDEGVIKLVTPELVTGGDYLKVLPVPSHPTETAVKFVIDFLPADLPNPITATEAGLFVDVDSGAGPDMDITVPTNVPVAYKSIVPALTKDNTETLRLTWEFRF